MKKLIIFDCDGVLIDSEMLSAESEVAFLKTLGHAFHVEDYLKKFIGLDSPSVHRALEKAVGQPFPKDFTTNLERHKVQAFSTKLHPLLMDILMQEPLASFPKAVASNSTKDYIVEAMKTTGMEPLFPKEHIFTFEDVAKGKPAPDVYLLAARTMGVAPDDCLVVEDSPAGIQAALAANMSVIAYGGGGHAGFSWYQERLLAFNLPLAQTPQELMTLLLPLIENNTKSRK